MKGEIVEKPTPETLLEAAKLIILEAAKTQCESCEEGMELWRGEDQPELYLQGYGDEISECESAAMTQAVDIGLLEIKVLPKCKVVGHDWYGEACPECEESRNAD